MPNKTAKLVLPIFALILVIFLNLYFRLFPAYLWQLKPLAKANIEKEIAKQVDDEFDKLPGKLSAPAKDKFVELRTAEVKKEKSHEIKAKVKEEFSRLKSKYQDASGQSYLMELDCWNWARYVENVLRYGHPGDEQKDGRERDLFALAPLGKNLPSNNLLYYLSAFLYRTFCIFKPVALNTFLFYLPLLFVIIFLTVLFLFCFFYWGSVAALLSTLFVGLCPIFISRSCGGWFDTDVLNLLFPLLAAWGYLAALNANNLKRRIFFTCLASFWIGLFAFTWGNWWFIFIILITYAVFSMLNLLSIKMQYKEDISRPFKAHALILPLFIAFSLCWVMLFCGTKPFIILYSQVTNALLLTKPLVDSIWPNVFSTVNELRRPDFAEIAVYAGGIYLFVICLVCLIILILLNFFIKKTYGSKYEALVLFFFWFAAMFFACFSGIRFAVFLLVPLGIFLGGGISELLLLLEQNGRKVLAYIVALGAILLGAVFVNNAYDSAKGLYPYMTDSWYNVLTNIKKNTPNDAIVNSWWDLGDWFKTVGNRRVIFDGQSQNTPQAYWMAKVLISHNEEEAIKILKMLNNGANSAFNIINGRIKDPFLSILIIKRLISSDPKDAQTLLSKYLPFDEAIKVEGLMFDMPKEQAYFIVYTSMQNIMGAISYIGNWDFAKVYITRNLGKIDSSSMINYLVSNGQNKEEAEGFLREASILSKKNLDKIVSKRLSFWGRLHTEEKNEEVLLFEGGLVYNPKQQTVNQYSCHDKKYKVPKSLFLFEDGKMKEFVYEKSDLDFSVLIFRKDNKLQAILLDPELAESLYVRLYFLNGEGLKHFKPFITENDEEDYIKVYRILWE
ncbi:MAG: hypothetical protein KJ818_02885 [Candidatus Omnitrophica bacterium]|nr:hypothetical protein [Candidatus Omnitrophota bacterium]